MLLMLMMLIDLGKNPLLIVQDDDSMMVGLGIKEMPWLYLPTFHLHALDVIEQTIYDVDHLCLIVGNVFDLTNLARHVKYRSKHQGAMLGEVEHQLMGE